jgi:hypothetical protein
MTAMSALDTLAHEIGMLYSFRRTPSRLYISKIKDLLVSEHSHRFLTQYLSNELSKSWYVTFSNYRHCTTHESLIGTNIRIDASLFTEEPPDTYVPLPDDPRIKPFTYRHNRELKSYCSLLNNKTTQLIRHSYHCILQDISSVSGTLPIA